LFTTVYSGFKKFVIRAGRHGNGHSDPGEFWDDNSPNGTRDGILNAPGDQDIGPITAVGSADQVCVNNQGSVAFVARDSNGQKALIFCGVRRVRSKYSADQQNAAISAPDDGPRHPISADLSAGQSGSPRGTSSKIRPISGISGSMSFILHPWQLFFLILSGL
jgi:hypothetical protein